jgi:hypothetical protein
MLEGKVTVVKPVYAKAYWPMETRLGYFDQSKDVRFTQLLKKYSGIAVMVEGRVIPIRKALPSVALLPPELALPGEPVRALKSTVTYFPPFFSAVIRLTRGLLDADCKFAKLRAELRVMS